MPNELRKKFVLAVAAAVQGGSLKICWRVGEREWSARWTRLGGMRGGALECGCDWRHPVKSSPWGNPNIKCGRSIRKFFHLRSPPAPYFQP